jgi:cysteine desulfuration protein SufE
MSPETQSDIDDLIEEFDFLGDWEERYRYLIELGQEMAPLTDDEKSDENRVKGCTSRVWLAIDPPDAGRFNFRADSDAHIVKGLAALLVRLYSGRSKDDIADIDPRDVLTRIELSEHLSPQRSNGLNAMIARIRAEAGVTA